MPYTGDINDYKGGENFLRQLYEPNFASKLGHRYTTKQASNQVGVDALFPIGYAAAGISPFAYQNLADIIASQGKTDPAAMNRDIAGIQRNTQIAQQDLGGQAAGMGLQGSGVMQALQQAIGQGGREQIAGRQSQETQMAEQRKRQDLQLFLELITNPALAASGMGMQTPKGPSGSEQFLNTMLPVLLAALG